MFSHYDLSATSSIHSTNLLYFDCMIFMYYLL